MPRYLWFLSLSFVNIVLLANWFDPRLIRLGDIVTDAGTLVFPLSFLLADVITEVYGYKYARRAIWCGFLFSLIFVLYGQLVIHLPSPNFSTDNAAFDRLFSMDRRIIAASTISYFSAEPLNSWLMAKLKIKAQGRYMGLRFISSSLLAAALDSVIFGGIAFYGTLPTTGLVNLIISMWLIKVGVECLLLPLSVALAKWLKRREGLDRYDTDTAFSLWRLDTNYHDDRNKPLT